MINIKINNTPYSLPTLQADLNAEQTRLIHNKAGKIRRASVSGSAIALESIAREILISLTGAPQVEVESVDQESIQILLSEYIMPLAEQVRPQRDKKNEFEAGWIKFRFPLWGKDINNHNIPLYNISAGEFCEASDLLYNDTQKYTPVIVAILCKDKNTLFDELRINSRADITKRFPQSIRNRVIAELKLTHRYMREAFPYCYSRKITWCDLLYYTASHLPSEIEVLKNNNCYDFMKIANSRLNPNLK